MSDRVPASLIYFSCPSAGGLLNVRIESNNHALTVHEVDKVIEFLQMVRVDIEGPSYE